MILYYLTKALTWFYPMIHLLGLVISVWAFRRCRKRGYLLMGVYFALSVFQLTVSPVINKHIRQREYANAPVELGEQLADLEEKKYALISEAIEDGEDNAKLYYPVTTTNIYLEPIFYVLGLWLLARREPSL